MVATTPNDKESLSTLAIEESSLDMTAQQEVGHFHNKEASELPTEESQKPTEKHW